MGIETEGGRLSLTTQTKGDVAHGLVHRFGDHPTVIVLPISVT